MELIISPTFNEVVYQPVKHFITSQTHFHGGTGNQWSGVKDMNSHYPSCVYVMAMQHFNLISHSTSCFLQSDCYFNTMMRYYEGYHQRWPSKVAVSVVSYIIAKTYPTFFMLKHICRHVRNQSSINVCCICANTNMSVSFDGLCLRGVVTVIIN